MAYDYAGQRCGHPYVATWAQIETTLAGDRLAGNDDPCLGAPELLRRRWPRSREPCRQAAAYISLRAATAATSTGSWPGPPHVEGIGFAVGAKRIALLWRLLSGNNENDWTDAIDMDGAQVAGPTTAGRLGPAGLAELNGQFAAWVETVYHAPGALRDRRHPAGPARRRRPAAAELHKAFQWWRTAPSPRPPPSR